MGVAQERGTLGHEVIRHSATAVFLLECLLVRDRTFENGYRVRVSIVSGLVGEQNLACLALDMFLGQAVMVAFGLDLLQRCHVLGRYFAACLQDEAHLR